MTPETKLEALTDLAESLGVSVRRLPGGAGGDHPGGALVRLKGRDVLFLESDATVSDRIAVAAAALRGRAELDDMYLPPELRELIDEPDAPSPP